MSAVNLGDITHEQYHADPCETPSLSASIAHIITTQSPLHAWAAHPRLNPDFARQEEQHFDIGTVAHALMLQGVEDTVEVLDFPDWRTKDSQAARDGARAAGLVPLLRKHWDAVQAMVVSAHKQLAAFDEPVPFFTDGKPEQTLIWDDDGATCRCRIDWLHDDLYVIDDYKTTSRTGGANPEAWSRTLFGLGADIQVAFYLRGLKAVTGVDAIWRYVVQETAPPYALSVVSLSPAVLALANEKVEVALEVWKRCLETDTWPGYPARVCWAELPPWLEAQWLERDAMREAA